MFDASDYAKLHSIVFAMKPDGTPWYPGYRPEVVESPNGDGVKDTEKKYAHVSTKYLEQLPRNDVHALLGDYLKRAHHKAIEVAVAIGVPPQFWPAYEHGALRVLEYSQTATTAPHTDFDLFTLMCYRNFPQYFEYIDKYNTTEVSVGGRRFVNNSGHNVSTDLAQTLNDQIHFGEILEEIGQRILPEDALWRAHKHQVVASQGVSQYSIVYFAIPDHEAVLPRGLTVGKWLEERIKRSRYER